MPQNATRFPSNRLCRKKWRGLSAASDLRCLRGPFVRFMALRDKNRSPGVGAYSQTLCERSWALLAWRGRLSCDAGRPRWLGEGPSWPWRDGSDLVPKTEPYLYSCRPERVDRRGRPDTFITLEKFLKTEGFDVFPVFQPTDGVGAHPSAARHRAHVAARPMGVVQRSHFTDCRRDPNAFKDRPVKGAGGFVDARRAFRLGPLVLFSSEKSSFRGPDPSPGGQIAPGHETCLVIGSKDRIRADGRDGGTRRRWHE